MNEAVIVAAARTPVATSRRGSLVGTSAHELAQTVVEEVVARAGVPPEAIDDVVLAESLAGGGVLARHAAIRAGMVGVPGLAVNRHCAASLSAIGVAAASVVAGAEQYVVAGGVESSSTAPLLRDPADPERSFFPDPHPSTPDAPAADVTITVGWNTAQEAGLSREEQDAWALRSHQRAVAAIDAGVFAEEIVPVTLPNGSQFIHDEHPRRGSTMEKLASLSPLHPEIEGFSVTAGNSSGVNDAAAAVLMTSARTAAGDRLPVLARVVAWTAVGVEPARTGMAPVDAVRRALDRADLTVDDVDMWEINEAFASVPLATVRELGIDDSRVNPYGSGCSLGHPVAATGARMVTTLVHAIKRGEARTAVAAMCAGGGMGYALVLRSPA